ncbi:MAG: hypothetical protein AAGI63_13900 [Planctomycetota bacterium]
MFDHAVAMADGTIFLNELNRNDRKLRLWRFYKGRFEFVLEGIKSGQVEKMVAWGDGLFVQMNAGDRFGLEIRGTRQSVWNRIRGCVAVAQDGALLLDESKRIGRHDGHGWEFFEHGFVSNAELYPLDNGDIWVAGNGILVIPGSD